MIPGLDRRRRGRRAVRAATRRSRRATTTATTRFYLEWDAIARDPRRSDGWLDEWVYGLGSHARVRREVRRRRWDALAARRRRCPARSTTGGTRERRRADSATRSEMMIAASARAARRRANCFVGVGLPNIACNLAQRTVAPDLRAGVRVGRVRRPARAAAAVDRRPDARHRLARGHLACSSCSRSTCRRGLIDVGFLGGAQIDRFGNLNTTVIGDYAQPEGAPAGLGRRVRDRDPREADPRDHAAGAAFVRRARSTSGPRPGTAATPRTTPRADGTGSGPTVRRHRPRHLRVRRGYRGDDARDACIPASRSRTSAPTWAGSPAVADDLGETPPPTRRGAPPDPRGARSPGGLHQVAMDAIGRDEQEADEGAVRR